MKHLLTALMYVLLCPVAWAQKPVTFVETQNVTLDVITPKGVSHIAGKPKQKKPTDIIFQKNGEDIGVYGKLEFFYTKEGSLIYMCQGLKFLVPQSDYRLDRDRNLLVTSNGQSVEALIVDIATDYECSVLKFRKDSVTVNTAPEYKMVVGLPIQAMDWRNTSYSTYPVLRSSIIDELDPDEEAYYTLAVQGTEGKVCRTFRLNRDLYQVEGVQQMMYSVPERDHYAFSENENGQKMVNGDTITGYIILKDFQATKKKRGAKKTKHDKRAKF